MKFTFKPFKGDKAKDASIPPEQRRREQVRRAQKSHRERKEAYTRSLEAEVVQLRANEARILHETKALYAEISLLKGLLVQSGVPVPPSPSTMTATPSPEALGVQYAEPMFDLTISDAKARNRQERIYCKRSGASSSGGETTLPSSPRCLGEEDHTAVGLDFVLTLEAPCLGHHAVSDNNPVPPNSHALTVTAAVLHEHPADPTTRLQPGPIWQVPAEGIERLLELSDSIPLDGELTPVQAWNQIRRHPQYRDLEVERLESLKTKLLAHIKCYGFGGVIDQGAFENAVFDAFVVGRVF